MLFLYWKQGMSIRLKDEKQTQFECYFLNKSVWSIVLGSYKIIV